MAVTSRSPTLNKQGGRAYVHPTLVKGFWTKRRHALHLLLIGFFLAIPWIKIAGNPLLLIDIPNRKFSVLGLLFRAHDVPILFLVAMTFVMSIFLVTALFGRAWCGWACPQTVFIENLFRRVEAFFEGPAEQRRARARGEIPSVDFGTRVAKWGMYIVLALILNHSFLAIFVGPDRLMEMIRVGPAESPVAFLFILVTGALIVFDLGWFREQFCIVACPYGRIQAVLQDQKTYKVSYQALRGEPRGKISKEVGSASAGDCVDCFRCVSVCPTGIDIRDGSSQLECIACTACMDACDDVMVRLKRPLGLIRYAPDRQAAGETFWARVLRPRVFAYAGLLLFAVVALSYVVKQRPEVAFEIFKEKGAPYSTLEGGKKFGNHFTLEISSNSEREILIESATPASGEGVELSLPGAPFKLASGEILRQPFFVFFGKDKVQDGVGRVTVQFKAGDQLITKELKLVGPY